MKKLLLSLISLLFAFNAIAQEFEKDGLKYIVTSPTPPEVSVGRSWSVTITVVDIPERVTYQGTTYTVTSIRDDGFKSTGITSISIPNTITSIGQCAFMSCGYLTRISFDENSNLNAIPYGAFQDCNTLSSIDIPKNVAILGMFAFMSCDALATVTFEENSELTTISTKAFYGCSSLTSITIPKKVAVVNNNAFQNCYNLTSVTVLAETAPPLSGIQFAFGNTPDTKTLTVPFGSDYSAWEAYTDWGEVNYKINAGETKTLNYAFLITDANKRKVINDGVMVIGHDGQLINETNTNIGGVIEVQTPVTEDQWYFVGAPFADYTLGAVKPVAGSDVAMVKYDYTSGAWSNDWATYDTPMEAGEGIFAWPFYDGEITFSTYNFGASTDSQYPADATANYTLNNGDVTVTESIQQYTANGYWMALANPYPAKLSADLFLAGNNNAGIQGSCVYVFRNGTFDIDANHLSTGDINMTEGFFVNFASAGDKSVTFKKNQLSYNRAKSSANEFIELTLQNGNDKVRVYFAQNEDAEQGYDILDANKMFATTGVAEPYFVTEGIALIKEEVRDLPYYATMNVRSQEDTVMNFVLTNLPEGYAVSIIDGEEVIDLVEGGVYSTEILTGENADRFKVLVKKNVGLADVEELDVRITNSNRHITITAQENVKVTVYNTLGQKVFETEETNFVLSGVASGAYVVKVQGAKASKSQKIVVE
ncbi:MAG: leucine-rich repeat domain-containing protein [Bacteroidales bacterium]|nr:leucine-rich repeat domain-containing protein [Bacteroidales bacterium]